MFISLVKGSASPSRIYVLLLPYRLSCFCLLRLLSGWLIDMQLMSPSPVLYTNRQASFPCNAGTPLLRHLKLCAGLRRTSTPRIMIDSVNMSESSVASMESQLSAARCSTVQPLHSCSQLSKPLENSTKAKFWVPNRLSLPRLPAGGVRSDTCLAISMKQRYSAACGIVAAVRMDR